MAHCHDTEPAGRTPRGGAVTREDSPTIALVGHPNVGKSTLFNLLTGSHQHTVNAPRTTVGVAVGEWRCQGRRVRLVDLPGTYSMVARSQDEEVTADVLVGRAGHVPRPDLAIVAVEATALASSLYLAAQVAETGMPIVIALTMCDVAAQGGIGIDQAALERELGVPVVALNPRAGAGAGELADAVETALATRPLLRGIEPPSQLADDIDALSEHADQLFTFAADVTSRVATQRPQRRGWSDKIDSVLLRWYVGIPVFLAVLWATFQLTTEIAGPIQDFFEGLVTGPVADGLTWLLALVSLDDTWVRAVLVDGVLTGVAVVVSFLPLMAIMFVLITLLEDSGYMARVAFVADRAMRAIGLDGRAMLPLVVGFGCNIPALAATKTLPNARQRTLTALLVPLTSCTARLVVYLLLATAFFPGHAGTVVFLMYVTSAVLIVLVGLALRRTAFRDVGREPLVLALPAYQVPRVVLTLKQVALRCKGFVLDAGKVIVVLSVAVWLLMAIPVVGGHTFGDDDMAPRDSLFGSVATAIAPVFTPAGFGDWHASSALITGFVAKEAVVGTLATTYGIGEPNSPTEPGDLGARLRASFDVSSQGHGGAAAIAFMVFCLAYTPCLVTVAEQKRLIGWRWTLSATAGLLIGAWLLAVAVFQVGRLV